MNFASVNCLVLVLGLASIAEAILLKDGTQIKITSPNYYAKPSYDSGIHFEWVKEADNNETSAFFFELTFLSITESCLCEQDYVAVYDGTDTRQPLILKTCGTKKPSKVRTSGPKILVVFHSDGANTNKRLRGFTAVVTFCEYCERLNSTTFDDIASINSFYGKQSGFQAAILDRMGSGSLTIPHKYPWYVFLINTHKARCGGVLISKRHLLTAAHCFERTTSDPKHWTVYMGKILENFSICEGFSEQRFSVESIILHSEYDKTIHYDSDLALVTLPEPGVRFTPYVRPIRLPTKDVTNRDTCWALGAGNGGTNFNCLLEAQFTTINTDVCNVKMKSASSTTVITANMICAEPTIDKGATTCHGDSGGPFLCNLDSDSSVLHGLVSFGEQHCVPGAMPNVFVRVHNFIKWIYKHVPLLNPAIKMSV